MRAEAKNILRAIVDGDDERTHRLCVEDLPTMLTSSWSAITQINEALKSKTLSKQSYYAYGTLLWYLVDHHDSKEVIFILLEACDTFEKTSLFLRVVPNIARVLFKLRPNQKPPELISIICDKLYSHLTVLDWTNDDYNITEDDKKPGTLHIKKEVATNNLLNVLIRVTQDFTLRLAKAYTRGPVKAILRNHLVKLLHYPLLYVSYDRQDPVVYQCFQLILDCLYRLYPTMTELFVDYVGQPDTPLYKFSAEKIVLSPSVYGTAQNLRDNPRPYSLGLANLAYLLFCKRLISKLPQVHTKLYELSLVLPCWSSMFYVSHNPVVSVKSAALLQVVFSAVECASVDKHLIGVPQVENLVGYLCWSMQFSELLYVRKQSAKLLSFICSRLNFNARYHLFLSMLTTETNPEILSYCYTLVKDFIHECWCTKDVDESVGVFYSLSLMEKIFCIPDGDEGDLLADLNKISAALNLARYLVTRDKTRSAAYTSKMNDYIRGYIKPVGQCMKCKLERLQTRLHRIDAGEIEPTDLPEMSIGGEAFVKDSKAERDGTVHSITRIQMVMHVYDILEKCLNGL